MVVKLSGRKGGKENGPGDRHRPGVAVTREPPGARSLAWIRQ